MIEIQCAPRKREKAEADAELQVRMVNGENEKTRINEVNQD